MLHEKARFGSGCRQCASPESELKASLQTQSSLHCFIKGAVKPPSLGEGFICLLPKDELGSHFVVGQQLLAGLLAFVLQRQRLVEHKASTPRTAA